MSNELLDLIDGVTVLAFQELFLETTLQTTELSLETPCQKDHGSCLWTIYIYSKERLVYVWFIYVNFVYGKIGI